MDDQKDINLTGNQISSWGKFWGGVLFIFFTASALFLLFAFWPDRMPPLDQKTEGKYEFVLFKVRLLDCDSIKTKEEKSVPGKSALVNTADKNDSTDTTKSSKPDSPHTRKPEKPKAAARNVAEKTDCSENSNTILLNTIFLVLVAITGFLGNMIHVATSFTTFVGNENFKRSWTLWYVVKPFTAAALAVIMYFMIRAGFLSYGSDTKNLSLYGILSISALTGLFTDIATLKLKEIFETIFKPKDSRDDKLATFKIDGIVPKTLKKGLNKLSIKGKGLDSKKLAIKIDGQDVANPKVTADTIDFEYTVADTVASQTVLMISVFDEVEAEIFKQKLTVE